MPLNLLAKKSWNVYNADNVARVRKDEEQARKNEEEEEYRMQVADAESRIDRLRRKMVEEQGDTLGITASTENSEHAQGRSPKRTQHDAPNTVFARTSGHSAASQLVGEDGHLNLFAETDGTRSQRTRPKKADKPPEPANASLRQLAPELKPWYSSATLVGEKQAAKTELQIEREERREERVRAGNDPLADMKRHLKATKDHERQRAELEAERRRELQKLKSDGSDDFSLDAKSVPSKHSRHGNRRDHTTNSSRDRDRHKRRRSRSRSPGLYDRSHGSRRGEESSSKGKRHRSRSRSGDRHGKTKESVSRRSGDSGRRERKRSRSRDRSGKDRDSDSRLGHGRERDYSRHASSRRRDHTRSEERHHHSRGHQHREDGELDRKADRRQKSDRKT